VWDGESCPKEFFRPDFGDFSAKVFKIWDGLQLWERTDGGEIGCVVLRWWKQRHASREAEKQKQRSREAEAEEQKQRSRSRGAEAEEQRSRGAEKQRSREAVSVHIHTHTMSVPAVKGAEMTTEELHSLLICVPSVKADLNLIVTSLRRRKLSGSHQCAKATIEILRNLVGRYNFSNAEQMMRVVKAVGRELTGAACSELCIGRVPVAVT
jgi:hypothetical protein